MKSFLRNTVLFMAAASMAAPSVMADGRHPGASSVRQQTSASAQTKSQRGTSGRPGLGGSNKGNGNASKPGNSGNNGTSRPGSGNNTPRPGSGNNNTPRPGSGSNNTPRPGSGSKPGNGSRPDINRPSPGPSPGNVRPGHPGTHPPVMQPPHRPYRPSFIRPSYRPVPPPAWRPRHGLPVIRGILGLTFGSALGVSLDYLYGNGYVVDGYSNDIVFLRNVPALNYIWTDGALYYGSRGFDVSSFYYSTPAYDMSRYNGCYSALTTTYGAPVSVNNSGGVLTATWFGGNSGYVTLSYGSSSGRFLTTLTFGI